MSLPSNSVADLVAEEIQNFEARHVHEAIQLIENGNTIPFIARYRRVQTGGMDAEVLRELKMLYDNLRAVKSRVDKIIEKDGNLIPRSVKEAMRLARSLEEINELYAPFKKGGKGTLAERARSLGLDSPAQCLLDNPCKVIGLSQYIQESTEGLQTIKEIETGIQHIIADVISKDKDLNAIMEHLLDGQVSLECKTTDDKMKNDEAKKFENYYDFCINISRIKSHQVLAINRGESMKVLTTRGFMSEEAKNDILSWLRNKWIPSNTAALNKKLLNASIKDSFKRLIEKNYLRRMRVSLTATAEREAIEVFSRNLKKLLLAPPIRGQNTLGIDPGFKHGCKLAALDKHGQVLETAVVYPFRDLSKMAEAKVCDMVKRHKCTLIAIGNGTACRETERFVVNLIKRNAFAPQETSYQIVNESGASVWSVSKDAQIEIPNLDPNLRSAVSIGRRLQDPLLELVKIEAKHIGVGMYQHDVNEMLLKGALEGVIEDCVSFVGIDLNSCSVAVLRRIAGVGVKKAELIVKWREEHGPFVNRKQLLDVKGLGHKCFEQCAGFVKVNSSAHRDSASRHQQVGKYRKLEEIANDHLIPEPLDQTRIHPESYSTAYRLIETVGANINMIGTPEIARLMDNWWKKSFQERAKEIETDEETLLLIMKALKQPLGYDLRSDIKQPTFRRDLSSIDELVVGQCVSGVVRNVTSFGVFVDFGIEKDGLIHQSKLGSASNLGPGDKCDCSVISVDKTRLRVGLKFERLKNSMPMLE